MTNTANDKMPLTTQEVARRFNELAKQEKWFEIQDELFSDDATSTDPKDSPWFGYAAGKAAVRKKGEDVVKKIVKVNKVYTTEPLVWGNHFAVGREQDTIHEDFGRMHINQIMLYEVRNGKIISEQFFY
jgi:ketosteroid isomerase-like protein